MDSIAFINRLAELAEEANHHPDMIVGWCKIEIAFTSHDQGGVTTACIEMAKKTNEC
jgi:4a-hydroxytetrahydrobiopterin dehydratase